MRVFRMLVRILSIFPYCKGVKLSESVYLLSSKTSLFLTEPNIGSIFLYSSFMKQQLWRHSRRLMIWLSQLNITNVSQMINHNFNNNNVVQQVLLQHNLTTVNVSLTHLNPCLSQYNTIHILLPYNNLHFWFWAEVSFTISLNRTNTAKDLICPPLQGCLKSKMLSASVDK